MRAVLWLMLSIMPGLSLTWANVVFLDVQPDIYDILLCLADNATCVSVRQCATRLLDALPTNGAILSALRTFLSSDAPLHAIAPIIGSRSPSGQHIMRPARLLYILQACTWHSAEHGKLL